MTLQELGKLLYLQDGFHCTLNNTTHFLDLQHYTHLFNSSVFPPVFNGAWYWQLIRGRSTRVKACAVTRMMESDKLSKRTGDCRGFEV